MASAASRLPCLGKLDAFVELVELGVDQARSSSSHALLLDVVVGGELA